MRKLLTLLAIVSITGLTAAIIFDKNPSDMLKFPAGKEYKKEWATVDSLLAIGQPKTALAVVEDIYANATKAKDYAQMVKTVFYLNGLKLENEEDAQLNFIKAIEAEVAKAPFPAKQVMLSGLADIYWSYYQNNRWTIQQRGTTMEVDEADPATWDGAKFAEKVSSLYMQSLQPADSLKRTPVEVFDPVILKGERRDLRPTLYDLLAHRAIDFFKNSEAGITQPAYKFYMDDPALFGLTEVFLRNKLQHQDSTAFHLIALQLLRELASHQMDFHNLPGLVEVELERLSFVKDQSILPQAQKDSLYAATLVGLEKRYANDSSSADISYALAMHYTNLGNTYNVKADTTHRWKLREAVAICTATIVKYPKTEAAKQCQVLLTALQQPSHSLQTEQVILPNSPALVQVSVKNVDLLYMRLVKTPAGMDDEMISIIDDIRMVMAMAGGLYKEWWMPMPKNGDHQEHRYEMVIDEFSRPNLNQELYFQGHGPLPKVDVRFPGLPQGKYYLLASNNEKFDSTSIISYGKIQVSNLAYTTRNHPNGGMEVMVLDRMNGQPISKAVITTFERNYNSKKQEYVLERGNTYKTDQYGRAVVKGSKNYSNVFVQISYKGDTVTSPHAHYLYDPYKSNEPKWQAQTKFFLDRVIYRPGQTVHFKGLSFENKGIDSRLLTGEKVEVIMRDRNYREIGKAQFVTNEYGTFNGSFTLPASNITGNVTLYAPNGNIMFKVEEYKRPKFEVAFTPITGTFRVDDSVTVKGSAKAYAGSNIDGAQVRYRVVREVQYPIWGRYSYKGYWPQTPPMEITSGVVTTDSVGDYTINFKALPDRSVAKESDPIFSYRVYADVTDISGETHSSETTVRVGYKALEIGVNLPDAINKAKQDSISLFTNNLNGQPEPSTVQLTIHQLQAPANPLRTRLWQPVDSNIIPETQFRKQFPLDAFGDEFEYTTWAKDLEVLNTTLNTATQTKVLPQLGNWQPGIYVVELKTTDRFGQEVTGKQYVTVFGEKDKTIPVPNYLWANLLTPSVEPGSNAKILVGTAAKEVRVLYEVLQGDKTLKQEWLKLSKEQQVLEIPITETHRGGISVRFTTVKDGRFYAESFNVSVPYPSKDLQLEFATFRDKLTPGAEEQWKITIKGPKGEKVAAELLASMYDASLDAFVKHDWSFNLPGRGQRFTSVQGWDGWLFGVANFNTYQNYDYGNEGYGSGLPRHDMLMLYGLQDPRGGIYYYSLGEEMEKVPGVTMGNGRTNYRKSDVINNLGDEDLNSYRGFAKMERDKNTDGVSASGGLVDLQNQPLPPNPNAPGEDAGIVPRKNLQETAFFYPAVETDAEGNFIIKFTVPEALTRWKIQGFAHTQALDYGLISNEAVTQKELMVFPNAPRFMREGDTIVFSTKVSNLSENALTGTAKLQLFDAVTMQPIDAQFKLTTASQPVSMGKGQSAVAKWTLIVPEGISAVLYRVSAQAGSFTDGEENALPILPNRMLVTETLPINLSGNQTKNLTFEKLVSSGKSKTLRHHGLTLELTANPAWYAIQALPYLMEYPYECSEQVFNRYYANSIAAHIANSKPQIRAVFEQWKTADNLVSNLEKNQELKNIILEETPWVLQAQNETERKKRVGLLFELNNLVRQQENSLRKLVDAQQNSGAWPWFKGGPDSRHITQYIVTGIGRLVKMGTVDLTKNSDLNKALLNGMRYLDAEIKKDYDNLVKYKSPLDSMNVSSTQLSYLYGRSFFAYPVPESSKTAYDYYLAQAQKFWNRQGIYDKGMTAIIISRQPQDKSNQTVGLIITSLKQTAINHEELGMYWKQIRAGYSWYEAPIEAQALLIEAFVEAGNDTTSVDAMRTWLLKQKQVQDWGNTKATADACYALLLEGTDWLTETPKLTIKLGDKTIDGNKNAEAGTGYSKTTFTATEVTANMGNITATREGKGISWGAVYWQYFEQLDNITPAKSPLSIVKKLYVQRDSPKGLVLEAVTAKTILLPGDLLQVRLEIRVDRDMEFVHLKDMRAAGLEPINVLSTYKWKGGLGYYESTRDAATNFFFDRLPRGTHVFEYPLRVNLSGSYSNGISTIHCMYAPEFAAHSAGVRITVK
ncbi:alpha-2-macroglobulin family protein [soil metagenome]